MWLHLAYMTRAAEPVKEGINGVAAGNAGTLALALLAAFWAGTNAVLTGMKLVIERQEVVEHGHRRQPPLDGEARRRVLNSEWLPLRGALAAVSAMLFGVIVLLPSLAPGNDHLKYIAWLTAVVPLCGTLFFAGFGISEYLRLRRLLQGEECQADPVGLG